MGINLSANFQRTQNEDQTLANTALVSEFLDRGKKNEAAYYACSMIYDAYFMMNKDE